MVTGQLLLKTSDDLVTADLVTGNPYFRQAGVEHNVINNNGYEFVFVGSRDKVDPSQLTGFSVL